MSQVYTVFNTLEGLAEQWAHLGTEATNVCELRATSAAFGALAAETDAREHHHKAWCLSPDADLLSLENALQCLVAAHQSWSDAIIALDPLFADPQQDATICRMLTEAMQRRTRLSCLLQELEREQLVAYQQIYQQHEVAIYAFGKEG